MEIRKVSADKKQYIDLLLLADPQESMIDRYLNRGEMFVLVDDGGEVVAECVVTKEGDNKYELKNIAVKCGRQRQGYGKKLIDFLSSNYAGCGVLLVGTGNVNSALGFYKSCGFTESHRVKNFFTDNYDRPMFEDGVQIKDMVYLKQNL